MSIFFFSRSLLHGPHYTCTHKGNEISFCFFLTRFVKLKGFEVMVFMSVAAQNALGPQTKHRSEAYFIGRSWCLWQDRFFKSISGSWAMCQVASWLSRLSHLGADVGVNMVWHLLELWSGG